MEFKQLLQVCLLSSGFLFGFIDSDARYRPSLFFREEWREIPAATPLTREHVANKDLVLGLYGPGCDSIKKSYHDSPIDDPYYIWSGLCQGNWAVMHVPGLTGLKCMAK